MTDNQKSLNTCGCCTRPEGPGSQSIKNRPGLSALAYRVGAHGQFKAAMKNALSGSKVLEELTVREDDDFSIALLDAWAVTADVLAFYQERIANEGYLRTADERLSLLHLARLIGYELSPGVAADAYLAFKLEDAPGVFGQALNTATTKQRMPTPPPPITIDIGIKAQSIPGPGEQAQIFETIEKINARARWNVIKPRLTQPQELSIAMGSIILDGTATDLKKGDTVLIIEDSVSQITKKILNVTLDNKAKTTRIDFEVPGLSPPSFDDKPSLPPDGKISDFAEKVELDKNVVKQIIGKTWKGEDLSTLVKFQNWSAEELVANITEQTAPLEPEAGGVFAFRQLAFVFGYNAVKQVTYSNGVPNPASQWQEWASDEEAGKVFLDNAYDKIMPNSYVVIQKTDETIESASVYQITDVDVRARSAYGISSKTTLLTLSPEKQWWDSVEKKSDVSGNLNVKIDEHVNSVSNYPVEVVQDIIDLMTVEADKRKVEIIRSKSDELSVIRDITIYAQSEQLDLAEVSIENIVQGDTITLDSIYLYLKSVQRIIITGERDDLKGVYASETRTLKEVIIEDGFSVITFDKSLTNTYVRDTVTINANIARATHGETVTEILGSGDAGQAFQQFTLRQPPLTYISASTPKGVQSTLELRVNDLLWKEVPSFYGHGPNERIYISGLDNDGKTHIRFGDGKTGSRLPSGQENVTATYRKSIGLVGLLKADQLSILMTRPFGLKEVTNPIGSSGAADPETLDQARQNTPLTILTLDRVVSLKDFENFTQAFAGIEKARADWVWDSGTRLVYLTVAGANGKTVDEESTLYQNLRDAIEGSCNGRQPFRIKSYVSLSFHLKANIQIGHQYIKEKVMTDVETTLNQVYSFKQRRLAQPVTKSEVMAVIQKIKGILAVDLDELFLTGEANILNSYLPARRGRWDRQQKQPAPAELLSLSPDRITLVEMKK